MARRKKQYPWEKHYPEGLNWHQEIEPQPLYSLLSESAERFASSPCTNFFGTRLTYEQIRQQVDQFAIALQRMGIKKRDRVGILLPNTPQFIIAYFAIAKVGAVIVNYNPLYTLSELSYQVRDSKTRIMITFNLRILFDKVSKLIHSTPLERAVVCDFAECLPKMKRTLFRVFKKREVATVMYGSTYLNYQTMLESAGRFKAVDIDPLRDVALVQYTGGTTGTPKGVLLSHQNVYSNSVQAGMWFTGLEEGGEKMAAVLPFFHVFAMNVVMNLGLLKGCEIILYPRLDLNALLKDIQRYSITLLPGVPSLFAAISNHQNLDKYNLRTIKACISGGAPLPVEVKKAFEAVTGCSLVEGYGLTEASPVVTCNPLFGIQKDGSIGIPLPDTVVEIRDPDGHHCLREEGEVGELCVLGPQVMLGYENYPEETSQALKSKRLHTGDLAYMDEDGYTFIVDRLKDVLIINGFNVYPREIEEQLYQHPDVAEAAVIGVPDSKRGQSAKAFVVINQSDKEVTEKDILAFLKERLAKYKLPLQIVFRDDLPKTLIGKIDKKQLIDHSSNS